MNGKCWRISSLGVIALRLVAAIGALPMATDALAQASSTLTKTGTVAASTAGHTGSTTQTGTGDTVLWVINYANTSGVPAQADIKDAIPAGTQFAGGSLQASSSFLKQWSINSGATWTSTEPAPGSVTNVRAVASNPNLVSFGSGQIGTVPAPVLNTINTSGSGGDGFRAIIYQGKIFVVNHHSSLLGGNPGTYLDCFDATTGLRCSGYATYVSPLSGTAFGSGSQVFVTSGKPIELLDRPSGRLYFPAQRTDNNDVGFVCADLIAAQSCGFIVTESGATAPPATLDVGFNVASAFIMGIGSGGGRIYGASRNGGIYCADSATQLPCPGQPFASGVTASYASSFTPLGSTLYSLDSQTIGNKIYSVWPVVPDASHSQIGCFDTSTNTACANFPVTTTLPAPVLKPMLNASGTPVAICVNDQIVNVSCFDLISGAGVVPSLNFTAWVQTYTGGYFSYAGFGDATTYGTRIFAADSETTTVSYGCFDFATDAACGGGFPIAESVRDYAYAIIDDPDRLGCLWAYGDGGGLGGNLRSFFAADGGTCNGRTSFQGTIAVNNFYCDGVSGHVTAWSQIRLDGLTSSDYGAVTLTITDLSDTPITVGPTTYLNLPVASFPVDISGIPFATYPVLKVTLNFSGISSNAPFIAVPPPTVTVSWTGDPQQVCFKTDVTSCNLPNIQNTATSVTTVGVATDNKTANSNTLANQITIACAPPGTLTLTKEVCTLSVPASCLPGNNALWTSSQALPNNATASWRIKVTNTSAAVDVQSATLTDAVAPSCVATAGTFTVPASTTQTFVCSTASITSTTVNQATGAGTAVATGSAPGALGAPVSTNQGSATATVAAAPGAVNDNGTTPVNTALNSTAPGAGQSVNAASILTNDTGTGISLQSVTGSGAPCSVFPCTIATTHGAAVVQAAGTYVYTPSAGYSGLDSFSYTIVDSLLQTATASVNLNVTPVAANDSGTTLLNTPLNQLTSILGNDTGSALVVNSVTGSGPACTVFPCTITTAHGSVVVQSTGTYVYTPANGYTGADSFTYTLRDGAGQTAGAAVNITINGAADVLTTVTPPASPLPNTPLTFTIGAQNIGTLAAANTVITGQIATGLNPANLTISNGGVYNPGTGIITWPTIASMVTGGGGAVAYTVTLPGVASGTVSVDANVSTTTTESNVLNNPSGGSVTLQGADPPAAIPTLNAWMLTLMSLLLALVGGYLRRRWR